MVSVLRGTFSFLSKNLKTLLDTGSGFLKTGGCSSLPCQTQIRARHVDWRMRRDAIRRQQIMMLYPQRQRLNALRKNNILPKELQDQASLEIAAMPRDSCIARIRNRCVVTSRPRGVQRPWRISRIVWRHLADYNLMSGVKRASW